MEKSIRKLIRLNIRVLRQMANLTIRLVEFKQTFVLPKEWLLKALPESLFASALNEDPEAATLDLTHPDVHPSVMRLLAGLVKGIEPLKHCPHLPKAHRYLNIPSVLVYGDVWYDLLPDRKDGNADDNKAFILKLVRHDKHLLYAYLLQRGYEPSSEDLRLAAADNSLNILRLLLARPECDPTANSNGAMQAALEECNFDAVKLLLAHPKTVPSYRNNYVFYKAVEHHQTDICRSLLTDPRINLNKDGNVWTDVIRSGNLELLKLLLADKRFTISPWNNFLEEAVELNLVELLPVLLGYVGPNAWGSALFRAVQHGFIDCLTLLLASSEDTDDRLYQHMAIKNAVEVGNLEAFTKLLASADVGRALDYCPKQPPLFRDLILADPRMEPLKKDFMGAVQANYCELTAFILAETKTLTPEVTIQALTVAAGLGGKMFKLLLADPHFDFLFRDDEFLEPFLLTLEPHIGRLLLRDSRVEATLGPERYAHYVERFSD